MLLQTVALESYRTRKSFSDAGSDITGGKDHREDHRGQRAMRRKIAALELLDQEHVVQDMKSRNLYNLRVRKMTSGI